MLTRRSSRRPVAHPAVPANSASTSETPVPVVAGVPMSRRAARANAAPRIDLSPVTAHSRRQQNEQDPVELAPDAVVEQVLAEAVVIVSADVVADADVVAEEETVEVVVETPEVVEDVSPADAPRSDVTDDFLAASETFRQYAGSVTAPTHMVIEDDVVPEVATAVVHVAPRRQRPALLKKTVAVCASVGVMGLAGLLAVSMTLPSEAIAATQGTNALSVVSLAAAGSALEPTEIDEDEIQAFVASSDVQNEALARQEDFSTVSLIDLAAEEGIKYSDSLYTNDPDAAIQWPYRVGVAMSSGYGPRRGAMHAGIDLVPGLGAPIQVIADGVVREATESGGAYGVHIYVDHIIDGELVSSHYAHMQYGSMRVKAGDTVKVGDIIGLTGNTGRSTGPHLHFEIIINGATVNPVPWMNENAGRHDGVTPVS